MDFFAPLSELTLNATKSQPRHYLNSPTFTRFSPLCSLRSRSHMGSIWVPYVLIERFSINVFWCLKNRTLNLSFWNLENALSLEGMYNLRLILLDLILAGGISGWDSELILFLNSFEHHLWNKKKTYILHLSRMQQFARLQKIIFSICSALQARYMFRAIKK